MWKEITKVAPPLNEAVKTKIDDGNGIRNQARLKFDGKLWWHPDGKVYVYYTPTHWTY